MPFIFGPKALPYLAGTSALVACVSVAVGSGTLIRPRLALDIGGFPQLSKSATPQDHKLLDGYLLLFGARELTVGATLITQWYNIRRAPSPIGYQTLGMTMLLAAGMVVGDGIASRKIIGEGEWKHWSFLPVIITCALGLLRII